MRTKNDSLQNSFKFKQFQNKQEMMSDLTERGESKK